MANVKEYAFYIEGSKLCIVERDTQFDNDVNSRDYGPGVHRSQWKSPKSSVTDGIQLLYTYSPTYRTYQGVNDIDNTYYSNGWTVIDGYVCFVRGASATHGVADWSSNKVVTGSQGDTGGQSLDYILVTGSSRWSGIHRIQEAGGAFGTLRGGLLKTYTRANNIFPYQTGVDMDVNTSQEIFDGGTSSIEIADDGYNVGDYVHISGFDGNVRNNGVFTVKTVTTASTSTDSKLTFDKRYYMPAGNTEAPGTELTQDTSFVAEADGGNNLVTIAKIEHDISLIRTDVDVLNDENDDIDLPPYLEKALVYYVKAKLAEDAGEFEMKEYFMREYKKITEKYESSLKAGVRMIATPGPYAVR